MAARRRKAGMREPQEPNFKNRSMVTGDNLDVLRGMNEACVDLVYLDPPFNSNRNYAAPTGSEAAGASFKDAWTLDDVDERWLGEIAEKNPPLFKVIDAAGEAHGDGMKAYLQFMSVRLLEMKRVLKDDGGIYLHVDPTASHYLKATMDCIFGKGNFRNEVAWCYKENETATRYFPRKHDVILYYARDDRQATFNIQRGEITEAQKKRYNHVDDDGNRWANMKGKMRMLKGGAKIRDWWADIPIAQEAERCGYPTQKPLKLLERIVKASSNEGDVVLDPFAGCATACVAAEKLNRRWVGIDISDKAAELVVSRMERELDQDLLKTRGGKSPKVHHVTDFAGEANRAKRVPRQKAYNHPDIKRHLFGQQEGRCACCGDTKDYADCQVDHVRPRAEGGSDNLDNLQILCGPCNREKATGLDFDAKTMSVKGIKARREAMQAMLDKYYDGIAELDAAEQAHRDIAKRRRRAHARAA